jgi:hypothetical protein
VRLATRPHEQPVAGERPVKVQVRNAANEIVATADTGFG